MSYLIALPCMLAVYALTGRSLFAALTLLTTATIAEYQWFTAGIDAVIAACFAMALANAWAWFVEAFSEELEETVQAQSEPARIARFCSQHMHDYAVNPGDSVFAISLINNDEWPALADKLAQMNVAERQGFYANLNYSSVSERALQQIINQHPGSIDAHILMGHVKLCFAKRAGLKSGGDLDELTSQSIGQAFKHFNIALRNNPDDPEALCGLLIAKGFSGLRAEHIMQSLEKLLKIEPTHLHGVFSAARFLVSSTNQANTFVALVERTVADSSPATVAIAKIIAHVECIGMVNLGANNSQVIADVYTQLRCYKQEMAGSSPWQTGTWRRGIADNLVAYTLQLIGDREESREYLQQIDGIVSPYPWKTNSVT